MSSFPAQLELAAQAIGRADALLFAAGAGMGVDSGLPDFRGNDGFWKAYPPLKKLGLSFVQMANPYWFHSDPEQAWGFYGHRRNLYRQAVPHAGFGILRKWAERMPAGYFVFTSNVDGHFQKAGFDPQRIVECHGSLEFVQCLKYCTCDVLPAGDAAIDIDETTCRARPPLPACERCGELARPNVLMFGDGEWIESRSEEQVVRYRQWLRSVRGSQLVIVECGAGTAVPTVRWECERLGGTLIRINVREPQVPAGQIGIELGALDALARIDGWLGAA
jgi:NAD-dependent SIR2 family protein deacetylase